MQVHVCEEEEKVTVTVEGEGEVSGAGNEISQAVDAPMQSSVNTLNLALQNASIMATNAVYGSGPTNISSSNSNSNNNNNSSKNSSVNSISAGSAKKKKQQKESKEALKEQTKESTDVEMKDSSVVEIKTEDSSDIQDNISFAEEEIVELIGHQSEVIGCAWNPQKKNLLASASGDSTVRFWTFPASAAGLYEVNPRTVNKNAKVLEHVLIKDNDRSTDVTCLEWRRDGGCLATGCYDGKARIWSAQGDLQRTLQKHTGPIFAVRWNVNGRFLLTCGIDGLSIIWDVEGGGVRYLLQHHASACLDADWRNETEFATSGSDKTVHFYDISMVPAEGTGDPFNPSCTLSGHTDEVNTVKFDPSGRWLATCSDDSTVRLWSLERGLNGEWQGSCLQVLTAHTKEVYTIKWSPIVGSGIFASASFDCSVHLWRISEAGGVTSMSLTRHTQPVYAIAFSPCGKYLASGSLDESLLIWSVQTGQVLKSYSSSGHGGIFDLEWREMWVAAGNSHGRVIVFEFNPEQSEEVVNMEQSVEVIQEEVTVVTKEELSNPVDLVPEPIVQEEEEEEGALLEDDNAMIE